MLVTGFEMMNGSTLDKAVSESLIETVEELLLQGTLQENDIRNALYHAVKKGDIPVVRVFLRQTTLSPVTYKSLTLVASMAGQVEMLNYLIDEGIDASAAGHLPLIIAVNEDRVDIVQVLIERQTIPREIIQQALRFAIDCQSRKVVDLLCQHHVQCLA